MNRLVFMVEEKSMYEVLKIIVPKIIPTNFQHTIIPHEGKSDLQKSIPRKLRAWRDPEVKFVVVHDQDSSDCKKLKDALFTLCESASRPDTLIRIVCSELESWFLADLVAIQNAFDLKNIIKLQFKSKYRAPDRLRNAKQELKMLVPQYQEISGSRLIAPHLDLDNNRSKSFKIFIFGIKNLFYSIF